MSGLGPIIGQERPIRILTTLLNRGNLPHAFLFTGIDGVGKQAAALALAMACNCREREPGKRTRLGGCGRCAACRRIAADNHPDVRRVLPAGGRIKIGQVREIGEQVTLKPYEADTRVVIVVEAQRMNAAAANALLKMLEEPPPGTLFVLTAPQPADVLPTVASRCQHLRFGPVGGAQIRDHLTSTCGLSPEAAQVVAEFSGGSLARAENLAASGWLEWRSWLIAQLAGPRPPGLQRLMALADYLGRDRDRLAAALQVLGSWLRDLLVHDHHPGRMLHADLVPLVAQAKAAWRPLELIRGLEDIEGVRRRLEANANPRLACEALLSRLFEQRTAGAGPTR